MALAPAQANEGTSVGKSTASSASGDPHVNSDSMPDAKKPRIEGPAQGATGPANSPAASLDGDLASRLADAMKQHMSAGGIPGLIPPPLPGVPPPPPGLGGMGMLLPPPPLPMQGRGLPEGTSSDGDIAARLADTLKSHMMGPAFVPPPPPPPGGVDLAAQLLASLQALTSTGGAGGLGFSQEGQVLGSVVAQSMVVSQAQRLETYIGPEGQPIRLPPDNYNGVLPDTPLDKSLSSGDGTVHRLPPGFGAIPQDIIDNRLREKEEERLRQRLAGQPCRYGRLCKRRDCPQAHPEGREIDSALNLCSFGRRCKRKNCFYDHPEGREIDFDPSKGYCKSGIACVRADCLYEHPAGRVIPDGPEARVCYFCHQAGHISQDCPTNPGSWCFNPAVTSSASKADTKAIEDGKSAAATNDGKSSEKRNNEKSGAVATTLSTAEAKAPSPASKDELVPAVSKSGSKPSAPLTPGPLPVGKMS